MSYVNRKLVFEVLDEVSQMKKKSEKVEFLRKHDSGALRDIIRGSMDNTIVWLLPGGEPPYRANVPESVPSNLLKECVKFKYLVKGPGDNVNPIKRENIFIGILESIHPADAKYVVDMMNKKPPKGITRPIVEEAFPGLLQDNK